MSAFVETNGGLVIPSSRNGRAFSEADRAIDRTVELYESTIADLRMQIEEQGWSRLDTSNVQEFPRESLGRIVGMARAAYLKNPLIKRSVEVGALYVWGQDLSVNAEDEGVKQVVDRFQKDNKGTLMGQQASRLMEVELQVTGNVFLALFPDAITGAVKVRLVPMEEVKQIVCNPDDRADVWYYERRWWAQPTDGGQASEQRAYHPHWEHEPSDKPSALKTIDGEFPILWNAPMLHVKAGAFPHWKWGVPEVYAALDWAKAYKEQLEDDATRSRALARFAWKATTTGGKSGVAAIKSKLGTTFGTANGLGVETNPPPVSGSTAILGNGNDLDPIRVAGATLDPDHSRPARLMAAAATGIPDHFFDPAIGNHATAKTMDRPTELRFNERRQLWRDVLSDLFQWVIDADIAAVHGLLPKAIANDDEARSIDLAFPDILEPDVTARVGAVIAAATLNGSPEAGTMPSELVSRLVMNALGVEDVDNELVNLKAEQDAKDQKAAEIAKQTAAKPPVPDPNQPPGDKPNPTDPTKQTEAKRVKAKALDLEGALAFFDRVAPNHAGLLGGESA